MILHKKEHLYLYRLPNDVGAVKFTGLLFGPTMTAYVILIGKHGKQQMSTIQLYGAEPFLRD